MPKILVIDVIRNLSEWGFWGLKEATVPDENPLSASLEMSEDRFTINPWKDFDNLVIARGCSSAD